MIFRIALTALLAVTLVSNALGCSDSCTAHQRCVNEVCVEPCAKVCKLPPCKKHSKLWHIHASVACWQDETDSDGHPFQRESCQCVLPDNIRNARLPSLSNCIVKEIRNTGSGDLNLDSLHNVAVWRVDAPADDVEFRETVADSRICEVHAADDIDFHGTVRNSFFGRLHAVEDVCFFNTFKNNKVGLLKAGDAIDLNDGANLRRNVIKKLSAKRCRGSTPPDVTIKNNKCSKASISTTDMCGALDSGFSCSFSH